MFLCVGKAPLRVLTSNVVDAQWWYYSVYKVMSLVELLAVVGGTRRVVVVTQCTSVGNCFPGTDRLSKSTSVACNTRFNSIYVRGLR